MSINAIKGESEKMYYDSATNSRWIVILRSLRRRIWKLEDDKPQIPFTAFRMTLRVSVHLRMSSCGRIILFGPHYREM